MSTTLVAPHCAGTSCICGKIKKSNVLHYICHFTSDKNNFLYSWLFFSLTWAENEHWQPLVALRPLEAVKSFISCPCDTGKQPLIPKIVSDTGKMTNEWSKVLADAHFASKNTLLKRNTLHCYILLKRTVCFKLACYSLLFNTLYPSTHFASWNVFLLGTLCSLTPFAS